ncbi:hypothetical protein C5167_029612 [Papaver somniferum]|nr:hypothetical protein C5167_029612 [Papaver somniferum]
MESASTGTEMLCASDTYGDRKIPPPPPIQSGRKHDKPRPGPSGKPRPAGPRP